MSGAALLALTKDLAPELDKQARSQPGLQALVAAALADPNLPLAVSLQEADIQRPLRDGVQSPLLWGLIAVTGPILGNVGRGWSFSTYELPLGETDPATLPAIVFRQAQEGHQAPPARHRKEIKVRPYDPTALRPESPYGSRVDLAGWLVAEYQERGAAGLQKFIEACAGTGSSFPLRMERIEEELRKKHSPVIMSARPGSGFVSLSPPRAPGSASGGYDQLPAGQLPAAADAAGVPGRQPGQPVAPPEPSAAAPAAAATAGPMMSEQPATRMMPMPHLAPSPRQQATQAGTPDAPRSPGRHEMPQGTQLPPRDERPLDGTVQQAAPAGFPQRGGPQDVAAPDGAWPAGPLQSGEPAAPYPGHPAATSLEQAFGPPASGQLDPQYQSDPQYPHGQQYQFDPQHQHGQLGQPDQSPEAAARGYTGAGTRADWPNADSEETTRVRRTDSWPSGPVNPAWTNEKMKPVIQQQEGPFQPLPPLDRSADRQVPSASPSSSGDWDNPSLMRVSRLLRKLAEAGQDRGSAEQYLNELRRRASSLDETGQRASLGLAERGECWNIVSDTSWCDRVYEGFQPAELSGIFTLVAIPDIAEQGWAEPIGRWSLTAPMPMIGGLLIAASEVSEETWRALMGLLGPFLAQRLVNDSRISNQWDNNLAWQAAREFKPPEPRGGRRTLFRRK